MMMMLLIQVSARSPVRCAARSTPGLTCWKNTWELIQVNVHTCAPSVLRRSRTHQRSGDTWSCTQVSVVVVVVVVVFVVVVAMLSFLSGHDKMWSGTDLRGASPLVSFDHVTDPHFVAFSSSLYTTICNPKPNPNLNSNPDPDPNPNPNPTVITDPQIGRRDLQIVTVQIPPLSLSAFCRVPFLSLLLLLLASFFLLSCVCFEYACCAVN